MSFYMITSLETYLQIVETLAFRDYQSSRKFFHVILRLRPSVIVTRNCKRRFVSL